MDKIKLRELILEKKMLDDQANEVQKKMKTWNDQIRDLVGSNDIRWDDLLLKVLEND